MSKEHLEMQFAIFRKNLVRTDEETRRQQRLAYFAEKKKINKEKVGKKINEEESKELL